MGSYNKVPENFIKYLLCALEDEEVKEKISNVKADSQETEILKDMLTEKEKEIHELKKRAERAESENEKAEQVISRLTNDKEELREELKKEKSKPKFDERLAEAYGEYCELPQEIRENLSNILSGENPVEFVLKGSEYALQLYERISMDWKVFDSETLKSMNKIFDYLFEQFCVLNHGYKRLHVEAGKPFDMNEHIRTADSCPSGIVKKVILCGYEDNNGKKAKSLVKVG